MTDRIKKFKKLFFPLSAREISELTCESLSTIQKWTTGNRDIKDRVFHNFSRSKVLTHIRYKFVERKKRGLGADSPPVNRELNKIVIRRLLKSGTPEAKQMLTEELNYKLEE